MPDAYLGRQVRCYLSGRAGNGDMIADFRRGVSDFTLGAELTRAAIEAEGLDALLRTPILLDESLEVGQITPTTEETDNLSRRGGERAVVALDYRRLRPTENLVVGEVIIPTSGYGRPYDDLATVNITLEQEKKWLDLEVRVTADNPRARAFSGAHTHGYLFVVVEDGDPPDAARMTATFDDTNATVVSLSPPASGPGAAKLFEIPDGADRVTLAVTGWGTAKITGGIAIGGAHEPF